MILSADRIEIREVFAGLYPKNQLLVDRIADSMRGPDGFREGHELSVWVNAEGVPILVDGHQRLEAARLAGIAVVPVIAIPVNDEREALEWAIREQRDRRNLSDKDRRAHDARAIAALDRPKEERHEAKAKNAEKNEVSMDTSFHGGDSATRTASVVGTSRATVNRVRTVLDSGDEPLKAKLLSGEITPRAAAREIKKEKKEKPAAKLEETKGFKRLPRRPLSARAESALSSIENHVEYLLAEVKLSDLGDGAGMFSARVAAVRKALLPLSKVKGEGQ